MPRKSKLLAANPAKSDPCKFRTNASQDLNERIAQLQEWGRAELIDEWRRLYGKDAPCRVSQSLMTRAIAYEWQAQAFARLSGPDQKLLDRMALAFMQNPSTLKPSLQIKNGTRLRRLWKGKLYEVTTVPDGFIFENNKYRSLSEIARSITGTRWNGPVFFGLKQKIRGIDDKATA